MCTVKVLIQKVGHQPKESNHESYEGGEGLDTKYPPGPRGLISYGKHFLRDLCDIKINPNAEEILLFNLKFKDLRTG